MRMKRYRLDGRFRTPGPALRIAGDALCTAGGLQVLEVAERLRQPPVRVGGRDLLAVDVRDDLERGALLGADRLEHLRDALGDELAVRVDVGPHVGERAAVPRQAEAGVEVLDLVERGQ